MPRIAAEGRSMKTLLVGALGMLALQALLVWGAYMARLTPEVVNCDRGRQSVTVRVSATFPDPGPDIARREFLGCNLWYHGVRVAGGISGD
jgi:hypothetical protein